MGDLHNVGQKIKGKIEVFKGNINQQRGQGVKGGLQKLKGKTRQKIADIKLNSRTRHAGAKGSDDWDRDDVW